MSIRLHVGLFLLKVSYYLRRLYLVILTPQDLIESNKLQYKREDYLRSFGNPRFSLKPKEKEILERYEIKEGKFLVLGCGGGRESIALARAGFEVVGVDFIKGMTDAARKNAKKENLKLTFKVQDMTRLSFPKYSFDYVGLFSGTYCSIPTRQRRIEFLKQVKKSLKPNGLFILTFVIKKEFPPTYRTNVLRAIGYLTLGNRGYQCGDELIGKYEFSHFFYNKEDVQRELEEAGFKIYEFYSMDSRIRYVISGSG